MERKAISKAVEAEVLLASRRRCCICAYFHGDYSFKKGQIAHIDRDRSNPSKNNLAFLCFDCHDSYDSTTRQSKNYTIEELRQCRDKLEEFYASTEPHEITVVVKLKFGGSDHDRSKIKNEVAQLVGNKIREIDIENGCIQIDLEHNSSGDVLPREITQLSAIQGVSISDIEVSDFRLLDNLPDFAIGHPQYLAIYLDEFVSKQEMVDVFRTAEMQCHFDSTGKPCGSGSSVFSIYVKLASRDNHDYAIIVFLTLGKKGRTELNSGVKMPKPEFNYSELWTPIDFVKAFAERFGIETLPFNRRLVMPTDGLIVHKSDNVTLARHTPYEWVESGLDELFTDTRRIYFLTAIDVIAYAKCLERNGVKIKSSFKKNVETKDRFRRKF